MTSNQKKHSQEIIKTFSTKSAKKYAAGQNQHGGNLWEKPMAANIYEEAIDQVAYATVLLKQHCEIAQLCDEMLLLPLPLSLSTRLKKIRSMVHT